MDWEVWTEELRRAARKGTLGALRYLESFNLPKSVQEEIARDGVERMLQSNKEQVVRESEYLVRAMGEVGYVSEDLWVEMCEAMQACRDMDESFDRGWANDISSVRARSLWHSIVAGAPEGKMLELLSCARTAEQGLAIFIARRRSIQPDVGRAIIAWLVEVEDAELDRAMGISALWKCFRETNPVDIDVGRLVEKISDRNVLLELLEHHLSVNSLWMVGHKRSVAQILTQAFEVAPEATVQWVDARAKRTGVSAWTQLGGCLDKAGFAKVMVRCPAGARARVFAGWGAGQSVGEGRTL